MKDEPIEEEEFVTEEEAGFKVGDAVELLKIYSPDMLIVNDGNSKEDGNFRCGWFDDNDEWNEEWFRWDFLKKK